MRRKARAVRSHDERSVSICRDCITSSHKSPEAPMLVTNREPVTHRSAILPRWPRRALESICELLCFGTARSMRYKPNQVERLVLFVELVAAELDVQDMPSCFSALRRVKAVESMENGVERK
jgi:hypothetical protein